METIEVRCPIGPRRLLTKLLRSGEHPVVTPDNLIEFACDDCKKELRRRGLTVFRVLHRYDLSGELVQSHIV